MTREDIIRMAREAGFTQEDHHAIYANLVYLAELVATAEREACARLCEQQDQSTYPRTLSDEWFSTATAVCAAAIRASGQQ